VLYRALEIAVELETSAKSRVFVWHWSCHSKADVVGPPINVQRKVAMIATKLPRNEPQLYWTNKDLPAWTTRFSLHERQTMVQDDIEAGRVAFILAAILTAGVVLALVSVWVTS
jgi:hypothetical protein